MHFVPTTVDDNTKLGAKRTALLNDVVGLYTGVTATIQAVSFPPGVPTPLGHFHYQKEAYTCPSYPCDNDCDAPEVSGPDSYHVFIGGMLLSDGTLEAKYPLIFEQKPVSRT